MTPPFQSSGSAPAYHIIDIHIQCSHYNNKIIVTVHTNTL